MIYEFTKRQSTFWEFRDHDNLYRVRFGKWAIKRYDSKDIKFLSYSLKPLPNYGFLWSRDWMKLYLYVNDVHQRKVLVAKIHEIVRQEFYGWPKSDYFFNRSYPLEDVISKGGLLINGPREIVGKIEYLLNQYGIVYSAFHADREWVNFGRNAFVIDAGTTYVIGLHDVFVETYKEKS